MSLGFDLGLYFTVENLRWCVLGVGSTTAAFVLTTLLRARPGLWLGFAAPVFSFFVGDWLAWPDPPRGWILAASIVGLASGYGFERLQTLGPRAVGPATLLACAGGVWLAVPENDPVLLVIGVLVGLASLGAMHHPGIGWGACLAVAWCVVLGARSVGWSFVGGLLCLAPLCAVGARTFFPPGGWLPRWPWFAVAAGSVAFAGSRWVAVAPDASWLRVAIVAGAAVVLAVPVRI